MGAGEHIARKGTKGDGPKGAFVMEVAEIQSAGSLEKTFSIDQAWLSEALEGTDLSPPTAFEAPLHIQARAVMDDVLVDGSFEALLLAPCARCNEPVEVSVGGSFTQLLTRGGSAPIEELELELTPEDLERETYSGDEIVLDGLVREFILLEVPMNPRCTPTCADPEVRRILNLDDDGEPLPRERPGALSALSDLAAQLRREKNDDEGNN